MSNLEQLSNANSTDHPFEPGTRVRHDGRQWSIKPFATVVNVEPGARGTYEYDVDVDTDANYGLSGERSRWNSNHTLGLVAEKLDSEIPVIN